MLKPGLSGGKNLIFSAVILPGIRMIFNKRRRSYGFARNDVFFKTARGKSQ